MKLKLSKVFQNKYLLYIVLVIAVTNVLGYLAKEQYNAVTFFLAIGLLSSYFTKKYDSCIAYFYFVNSIG